MPSRLFWFLAGGAAATYWSTKHCDSSRQSSWRNGSTDARTGRPEEQKDRMNAFGDTITDMSEATLDSVISAVTALKAKLAETRAHRELQQQQQQQQPSSSGGESSGKTQPPRYV